MEKEYIDRWLWAGIKPFSVYPEVFAAINGLSSSLYVPENIYYNRIEPVLNNKAFAAAYSDKNFYESYLAIKSRLFPATILRYINDNYYDDRYRDAEPFSHLHSRLSEGIDYILKPAIETSGGVGLALVRRTGDLFHINKESYKIKDFVSHLKIKYPHSFLLQEQIKQHAWFEGFNSSSVNTVRLFVYRSVNNNNVHALQAVIRFGREGSIVDNQAAGGLSCGISSSGYLNDFAIDKSGRKYTNHKYLSSVAGLKVPGYEEMIRIAESIASKYYYHRILGFDFCLDNNNNIRLLEINCKNIETNFLQMNNGPLFGVFTDEIIAYCKKNRSSVVFDFYV